MRAGVRPGLQTLRVLLCGTGRFDSDTLPPDCVHESFQAPQAETVPRRQGSQTAGPPASGDPSADPATGRPEAQATQTQEAGIGPSRRSSLIADEISTDGVSLLFPV